MNAREKFGGSVALLCGVLLCAPSLSPAQGTVSGRIAIQDKPGEKVTDFASTVVYLTPRTGTPRVSEIKTQMAINGRAFSPRVRVVTVGSSVEYPNQDPFSHNVFSTAPGASFDLGIYGSGTSKAWQFRKAGAFPVYCNIHEKMTAYVVVVSTPYHALAAADGRWNIAKVPAGKYALHFWHERAAEVITEVDVPAAGLSDLEGKLDASGFKQLAHKNKFGQDYAAAGTKY